MLQEKKLIKDKMWKTSCFDSYAVSDLGISSKTKHGNMDMLIPSN